MSRNLAAEDCESTATGSDVPVAPAAVDDEPGTAAVVTETAVVVPGGSATAAAAAAADPAVNVVFRSGISKHTIASPSPAAAATMLCL